MNQSHDQDATSNATASSGAPSHSSQRFDRRTAIIPPERVTPTVSLRQ
jgi:hypothetical protein